MWKIDQFDYSLPPEQIAQTPANPRDSSRLLVLNRQTGEISHKHFFDLPSLLTDNDVIVRNNTKVIPARVYGKKDTGGACEILLLHQQQLTARGTVWECMTKPGLKVGQTISFPESDLEATCTEITGYTRILEFNQNKESFYVSLEKIGHTPIPPYIHWANNDEATLRQLYQTTFAKVSGSAAAPTAGLHFTPELDEQLRAKGVQIEEVTLHVGLGTFLPVQDEQIQAGQLHHEWYEVKTETAQRLNQAKKDGKRIIAVGTTTSRTLESCATQTNLLEAKSGETTLFIQPGYQFKFVDALLTNFHLPKSSLLMLISALVSAPNTDHNFQNFAHSFVGKAYLSAVQEKYRFFSFGDAMFIT
jgi:S-adenosylmethionine:tRNA ribosyltransferase-isomerase